MADGGDVIVPNGEDYIQQIEQRNREYMRTADLELDKFVMTLPITTEKELGIQEDTESELLANTNQGPVRRYRTIVGGMEITFLRKVLRANLMNGLPVVGDFRQDTDDELSSERAEEVAIAHAARAYPRGVQINNEIHNDIEHPHILKPRLVILDDRTPQHIQSIIFDDASHGVLKTYMENNDNRSPPVETILRWAAQLFSALERCHSTYKIVHRDINPEHIYVFEGADGVYLKLGDFMISRKVEGKPMTNRVPLPLQQHRRRRLPEQAGRRLKKDCDPMTHSVNSRRSFASPESIKPGNLNNYGYKTDIWSLGAIIYYLSVNATEPFSMKKKNKAALYKYIKEGKWRDSIKYDLDRLDPRLKKIIEDCWQFKQKERKCAQEFVEYLANEGYAV